MQYQPLAAAMRDALGTTRTEAKLQALGWLANQLRWESMLDTLRAGARRSRDGAIAKAA